MTARRRISFVLPVYNGAATVEPLHQQLSDLMATVEDRYAAEFIWIDDGSADNSWAVLQQMHEADARCTVICLSRNFGHQMSLTAGLDYALGDAVIIMDTDLQDPPGVCLDLIRQWERGNDVVYAQRRARHDPRPKRMASWVFYRMLDRLADIKIPKDTGEFRLIDAAVAQQLRGMREQNRFLRGMISFLGFRQTAVLFDRPDRAVGESGYTMRKLLKLALDGITSFSTLPLRLIAQLGFLASMLAFAGILYALVLKLFFPDITVPGWTMTLISILFLGGVQMFTLGVVGTYVGRIYSEVQNRPLYVISSMLERPEAAGTRVPEQHEAIEARVLQRAGAGEPS